ncbi:MAG: cadherin-like beta sandwich domain-containing protein, partial [Bacilli bacterium]
KNITLTSTTTTTSRAKSSNAKLTSLTLSAGTLSPAFNGSNTSYKVLNLKDTIKNVTISPKCDMCNIKIICESGCTNYNNQNRPELIIGKNVLKIETISEDGSNNSEYDLIIYRGETTDNSTFLEELEIEDFKISEAFDKENLDYTLTVPNDTTFLNIIATPEDDAATIEIKGADDLQVGENVVTITITSSETKDKKIYNITVTRLDIDEVMTTTSPVEPTSKNNNTLLIIIITLISLAIIATAGYFIFRKKKPKNGKKDKIAKDGKIKMPEVKAEIEVKEDDIINDLNITVAKTKPTVDEALADLMTTKEIIFKEE